MLCEAMSRVVIMIKECGVGEGTWSGIVWPSEPTGWEVMGWWRRVPRTSEVETP